jgi:hypothetical protein
MKKVIKIAQLISLTFVFFVVEKAFVQASEKAPEKIIKPESIDTIAQEKLKLAQEAQKRAENAAINEKTAEAQADIYKKKAMDPHLNEMARQQALVQQKAWDSKVKEYAKKKTYEEENEKQLQEEADALHATQNQLATEFVPTTKESSQKNILEERFKKCIKAIIIDGFKAAKIDLLQTTEFQNTVNQLSQKLGELTLYERIHFYKSNEIIAEQWREIHEEALANPSKYEPQYIELLESIDQLKKIVAETLKLKNIKEPTTEENNECLIKVYPAFDKKLQQLEKLADESDEGWEN